MASFYRSVTSKTYINVLYALNIALDNYLAEKLLNDETDRIVYSSTDFALIKRSGQNPWNNANLPFINYRMDDKTQGGTRNWFSWEAYSSGVYIPELKKKIKLTPISITYDCSYFSGRDDDYQYASDIMLIDASDETKLEYYMDYNGVLVKNIAILDFNFDTSPQYTEKDWLEKNNIWMFSLNPSVQTFLPVDNVDGFCIPKKVLIDFAVKKDLIPLSDGEIIEYEEVYELTVDHLTQNVSLI